MHVQGLLIWSALSTESLWSSAYMRGEMYIRFLIYIHIHTYTYTYTGVCSYIYVYICICTYILICIQMYTYVPMYTYPYICVYIQRYFVLNYSLILSEACSESTAAGPNIAVPHLDQVPSSVPNKVPGFPGPVLLNPSTGSEHALYVYKLYIYVYI